MSIIILCLAIGWAGLAACGGSAPPGDSTNAPSLIVELNPNFLSKPFFKRIFTRALATPQAGELEARPVMWSTFTLNPNPQVPRLQLKLNDYSEKCKAGEQKKPWCITNPPATNPPCTTTESDITEAVTCGPTRPRENVRYKWKWCSKGMAPVPEKSPMVCVPTEATTAATTEYQPCKTYCPPQKICQPCPTTEPCKVPTLTCPTMQCLNSAVKSVTGRGDPAPLGEDANVPTLVVRLGPNFLTNPFVKKLFPRGLNSEPTDVTPKLLKRASFTLNVNPTVPRLAFNLKDYSDRCDHSKKWCILPPSPSPPPCSTTDVEYTEPATCGPTRPPEEVRHRWKWCSKGMGPVKPKYPMTCYPPDVTTAITTEYNPCKTSCPTFVARTRPTNEPCKSPTKQSCSCSANIHFPKHVDVTHPEGAKVHKDFILKPAHSERPAVAPQSPAN